jgi:cell division protein FtsW
VATIKTLNRNRQRPPSQKQTSNTTPHPNTRAAVGHVDKPLLYATIALAILGLCAVFSASAAVGMDDYGNNLYFAQRQLIFFIMGFAIMFGISKIPYYFWQRFTKPFAFCVIGLLAYTMFSGVEAYGAERWIRIFGFQFQPSELGKISVVLLLAQALSKNPEMRHHFGFLFNLALISVTLLLIYEQPSLSMTIILSLVSAGMLFVAGIPVWLIGGIGAVGSTVVIYKLLHTEYQMRRIQGWLDPWKDSQDTGYNLIQSLYAIGSGGIIGTGLGMSHQKLHYLPFQYTDFIFSVWAEEWGFIGCLVLLGLFIVLLYRGYSIAKTCRSSFGQLMAMGITLMLAAQITINLFVATGLFPVTGVTLPLISYGGTSVIVTLFMIGMLLGISRYNISSSVTPLR